MLFIVTASWKIENNDKLWKRFAERRVPIPDNARIIEYYYLIGQNKTVAVIEADNHEALAQSALNWEGLMEVQYHPAITTREYYTMREKLLK